MSNNGDNGAVGFSGPALSVRIYLIKGKKRLGTAKDIVKNLERDRYKLDFIKADSYYEGFINATINGNLVEVEYYTGQKNQYLFKK
jgi:hypothetical protein